MGKVYHTLLQSSIPRIDSIACIVPTDYLLVSSVSNWGGYALAAASALLFAYQQAKCDIGQKDGDEAKYKIGDLESILKLCLPSAAQEKRMCERMIGAGARDGVSGRMELSVDGMPLQVSFDLLNRLRNVLHFSPSPA